MGRNDRLEALLAQMTLEEKVGQLGIFADMLRPFAPGINPEMNERDASQTLELIRSGRDLIFNIAHARTPMPKSTRDYIERCAIYLATGWAPITPAPLPA